MKSFLYKLSLWEVTKLDMQNFRRIIYAIQLPSSATIGARSDGGENFTFAARVYLNAFLVHFHQFGVPAYY